MRVWILPVAFVLGLSSCEKAKHQLADSIEKHLIKDKGPAVASAGEAASSPWVSTLSADTYDAFMATPGGLLVVCFYSEDCGVCRELSPMLEAGVAEQEGKVLMGKVEVNQYPELANKMGIRGVPDVRLFRDGKQVDAFQGAASEKVVRERLAALVRGPVTAPAPTPAKPTPKPQPTPKPVPTKPAPKPQPGEEKPQEEPKQTIAPMEKDWLPPGIERR